MSTTDKYTPKFWVTELNKAEDRLKPFHRLADQANQAYLATPVDVKSHTDRGKRLNLFHSNTSTMEKMLYGKTPKVDVKRTHADPDDDVARLAATLMQRMLTQGVESRDRRFGPKIKSALQDRLVPGLGVAKWRYEVDDPNDLTSEYIPLDYHHWRDVKWSYARTWDDVWWFSFDHNLTREQVKARFDQAKQLQYEQAEPDKEAASYGADNKDTQETAVVTEIWCRRNKTTYYLAPQTPDIGFLDKKQFNYGIRDYYTFAPPMIANPTTTSYLPAPDWHIAKDLYQQIDKLVTREDAIIDALRVRGVYDSAHPELKSLLRSGDNVMTPVDMNTLSEKGGLKKAVEFLDLGALAAALGQVTEELGRKISLLDQVTGMSELMRGGGGPEVARVSASRDKLASRYGSVKVQSREEEFEDFVASLLDIRADIISAKYSPETIIKQSNAKYLPEAKQPHFQELLTAAIELIKTPSENAWRIKVQPRSLSMAEYTQLRQERSEALVAFGTYVQSMAGMIEKAPETGPGMMQLLGWGLSGFRGFEEVEGIVDNMARSYAEAQQRRDAQPQRDPASTQLQVAQIKAQADLQETQMKIQADMRRQREQMQFEFRTLQAEFMAGMQELMQEYGLKRDLETHKARLEANVEENKQVQQAEFNTREKVAEANIKQAYPDPVEVERLEVERETAIRSGRGETD